jgi:NADH-quinone oxidoreductase subunit N
MPLSKLALLYPQIALAAGIILVLLFGWRKAESRSARERVVTIALAFLAVSIWLALSQTGASDVWGILQFDLYSSFFLIFAALTASFTLVFSAESLEIARARYAEFTALLLTICIGISMMATAKDLLTAYLALETVSLSSYILTGFRRNQAASHEAALKYVIYGGVASGIMVFGMSLLYGLTGSTSFAGLSKGIMQLTASNPAYQQARFAIFVGIVFLFTGFLFKIAAAPFHMWCPDVYQGAPTPFTGFLSVAPKAGGFALIMRFLSIVFPQAGGAVRLSVLMMIGLISAVTMVIGNLTAIHQTSVKRLLAFSSIAHAGYLLMGIAVLDRSGFSAIMIYLVIYLFMNIGAFAVVQTVSDRLGSDDITNFRGLGYKTPFLALSMAVFLFSLAGLPPLAGFIGKFYLFAAILKMGGFWYLTLAVIGILNSVVGLFYYARIIREMFLSRPEDLAPVKVAPICRNFILVSLIPIIVFGIYWEPLASLANAAVAAILR